MKAEILCIGTELLLGDIVNTNAAFLAQKLAQMGIEVYHQTVVGDNPERLKTALGEAFSRCDLVLTTGGLGPTYDDLTKETVAQYLGREMVTTEEQLTILKNRFAALGHGMTENNLKQAAMPEGATVLPNPNGTAPGLIVEGDGKIAVLMPGPPKEMQPMMENSVIPYLMEKSGQILLSRTLHVFGVGESTVEYLLKDLMTGSRNPTLAPYAKMGEVTLRITAKAKDEAEANALIDPMEAKVRAILDPKAIYGVNVAGLQDALVKELTQRGLKIATAESCTGGYISKRITEVPGSSAVLDGGVVSYSNEIKEKLLGVSHGTLVQHGAVSRETALEMARGIRSLCGADIGVSTTGIAGPGGGTAEKPVGLVYLCVSSPWREEVFELHLARFSTTLREDIRYMASSHALYQALLTARMKP